MHNFNGEVFKSSEQIQSFIHLFLNCYNLNVAVLIVSLIYIDRLVLRCQEEFVLSQNKIKNTLLTALSLASKFLYDNFDSDTMFYAIGGIHKHQMKLLMNLFIDNISFELFVREIDYKLYHKKIVSQLYSKVGANGNNSDSGRRIETDYDAKQKGYSNMITATIQNH